MAAIEIPQFAEFASAVTRQLPRDIDPARAQRWINDQRSLAVALRNALCQETRVGTAIVAPTTTSEWVYFFGHLWVWNPDFNESNFPLGEDPGDEAEEVGINHLVSFHQAVAEFDRLQRQGASLWAQGRYINAHPKAQKAHPLVGIGARWLDGRGDVFFPVFGWNVDRPSVDLNSLDDEFSPPCRFLLRKES